MTYSKRIHSRLIQPIQSKKVLKVIQEHIPDTDDILVQIFGNCDQTLLASTDLLYIIKPGFTAKAGFGAKLFRFNYAQIHTLEITKVFQTGVFWFAGPEIISPFQGLCNPKFDIFYTAPNCIPFTTDKKPLFERAKQIIQELIQVI